MSTENIVKGKYYRILKDKTNKIWDRISYWTHADDVELSSGATLSSDLTAKQTKITATQSDFGQVETSPTTHAYTKGQMLIYNNQLYRVKAAIAVGATLTVGTNIEAISVSTLSSMLTAANGNQFYFDYKDSKPGFYPSASKTASEFVPFGGTTTLTSIIATEPSGIGNGYIQATCVIGNKYLISFKAHTNVSFTLTGLTQLSKAIGSDEFGGYVTYQLLVEATSTTCSVRISDSYNNGYCWSLIQ